MLLNPVSTVTVPVKDDRLLGMEVLPPVILAGVCGRQVDRAGADDSVGERVAGGAVIDRQSPVIDGNRAAAKAVGVVVCTVPPVIDVPPL